MGQFRGCVKYILFIFNFALWLLGCALLSVGIWMKVDDAADHTVRRMTENMNEEFQIHYSVTGDTVVTETMAYLLILFGIIIIIVTFIGCCGAVRENQCLLAVFAVCLLALMVTLFGIGGWAIDRRDNVEAHTPELRNRTDANLNKGMETYYKNETSRTFIDNIQTEFHCCGINSRHDYAPYNKPVPRSCVSSNFARGCGYYYYYYAGEEIEMFLEERFTILGAVAIGVALVLGIGMVVAILLCCLIKRDTTLVVA